MSRLTAIILARNEEETLERTLKSLAWCDELIVINDYSEDETAKIAKKYSAKVFSRHLDNDFSSQRNFGLSKATSDWILFIDADEIVTKSLQIKLQKIINEDKLDGVQIRRADKWMGRVLTHGEWGNTYLLRLGKRKKGQWQRRVHEYWDIKGQIGKIDEPILHYPHQTVSLFLDHINSFSRIHGEENLKEGKHASLFKVFFYPPGKFILNFVIKGGYKDGIHGFIYALLLSFHSFIAWSSLWLKKRS